MKIKLLKRIHSCFASCSSNDRAVEMDIEMPVCPQVGWSVLDEEVKELWWDGNDINCFVEEDKTYYDVNKIMFRATKEQMDELVIGYIEKGWSER